MPSGASPSGPSVPSGCSPSGPSTPSGYSSGAGFPLLPDDGCPCPDVYPFCDELFPEGSLWPD